MRVFRDKRQNVKFIIVKIESQLKESLNDQLMDSNLSQQDLDWGALMNLNFSGVIRQNTERKTKKEGMRKNF